MIARRRNRVLRGQPGSRTGQGGFTLLEILLAFLVFAVSFSVVLQIMSSSMRSTVRAREYTEATLVAQSLMDMVGKEIPLEELALAGDSLEDYHWDLVISPFEPEAGQERVLEIAEVMGTQLYWVDLELAWGEGAFERSKRFSTVRAVLK